MSVYAAIDRLAAETTSRVITWRHHVHANPELSNREARTAAYIAGHLRDFGLDEVRTDIAGHGVVGVLRGGRPGDKVIALRADIDALPVPDESRVDFASTVIDADYPGGPFPVSHACGHDCHVAMLLGAAKVLSGVREELPGTVLFVFQPAEEGPPVDETGGARAMQDAGALADPEPTMVFGMHIGPYPRGVIAYRVGNQFAASCLVRIVLSGKQVHGSTPWLGIDPMPPAAAIIGDIGQLYRQLPAGHPVTVSIGHVEDVGRFNIIGERVTLWGTIRCAVEDDMATARAHLKRLAEHQGAAYGCEVDVSFLQDVPAVHNTPAWVEAALPTMRRVVGEDQVVAIGPTLGYDDISVFVNRYGGLYVLLGAQDTRMAGDGLTPVEGGRGMAFNHNPKFYAYDEDLVTGVRMHANIAVDHLTGVLHT